MIKLVYQSGLVCGSLLNWKHQPNALDYIIQHVLGWCSHSGNMSALVFHNSSVRASFNILCIHNFADTLCIIASSCQRRVSKSDLLASQHHKAGTLRRGCQTLVNDRRVFQLIRAPALTPARFRKNEKSMLAEHAGLFQSRWHGVFDPLCFNTLEC